MDVIRGLTVAGQDWLGCALTATVVIVVS